MTACEAEPTSPAPLRTIEERDALVLANQGLIWGIWKARRHWHVMKRLGEADAVSIGQIALIRAAETWIEGKTKFSTLASVCITRAITRAAWQSAMIPPPHGRRDRCPGIDPLSLSQFGYADGNCPVYGSGDIDPADDEKRPVEIVDNRIDVGEAMEQLRRERPKWHSILVPWMEGKNFKEIAQDLGCSPQRVQQVFVHGINRLREIMKGGME